MHPLLNREERWGGFVISGEGMECSEIALQLRQWAKQTLLPPSLPWFVPVATHAQAEGSACWPAEGTIFLTYEPENADESEEWAIPAEAIRFSGGKAGLVVHPLHRLPGNKHKWDFLVLDASQARTLPPLKLMVLATQSSLVFTGIKSRSDFDWAMANQASLTDTEFLIRRNRDSSPKPDVLSMHVLQLLSLLTQDADTRDLEEIFRQEPKLSYSLLRLVNSAALSLQAPISSFSQAISILGRRQLQRWLQLLVYVKHDDGNRPNPMLQWAAMRGKMMELSLEHLHPAPQLAITTDCAFMTGIFSLLDVLLDRPMEDILAQLPIASTVKLALTERAGPLGDLLSAIEAAETRKFDLARQILSELGISPPDYARVQLTAIDWGNKVTLPALPT